MSASSRFAFPDPIPDHVEGRISFDGLQERVADFQREGIALDPLRGFEIDRPRETSKMSMVFIQQGCELGCGVELSMRIG